MSGGGVRNFICVEYGRWPSGFVPTCLVWVLGRPQQVPQPLVAAMVGARMCAGKSSERKKVAVGSRRGGVAGAWRVTDGLADRLPSLVSIQVFLFSKISMLFSSPLPSFCGRIS